VQEDGTTGTGVADTIGAAVAVGDAVGVAVGAGVPVGAAVVVGEGVELGWGVALAVGAGTAVGVGVAATAVAKTNTADAAADVSVFLFPFAPLLPLPVLVWDEPVTTPPADAARTSCVPVPEAGTVNVARNEPLPPTLTEGIPAAEPSQVSWTVVWPKLEPETVTTVPAVPDAGESERVGVGSAA
jgi:hypothetical protein